MSGDDMTIFLAELKAGRVSPAVVSLQMLRHYPSEPVDHCAVDDIALAREKQRLLNLGTTLAATSQIDD